MLGSLIALDGFPIAEVSTARSFRELHEVPVPCLQGATAAGRVAGSGVTGRPRIGPAEISCRGPRRPLRLRGVALGVLRLGRANRRVDPPPDRGAGRAAGQSPLRIGPDRLRGRPSAADLAGAAGREGRVEAEVEADRLDVFDQPEDSAYAVGIIRRGDRVRVRVDRIPKTGWLAIDPLPTSICWVEQSSLELEDDDAADRIERCPRSGQDRTG